MERENLRFVTPTERRGCVVQLWPLANRKREEPVDEAKPFKIPKREIWEAFKRVKANQGAAGARRLRDRSGPGRGPDRGWRIGTADSRTGTGVEARPTGRTVRPRPRRAGGNLLSHEH